MDERVSKLVSGKFFRFSKMRFFVIILLVFGGVFNFIFIEFGNCLYL